MTLEAGTAPEMASDTGAVSSGPLTLDQAVERATARRQPTPPPKGAKAPPVADDVEDFAGETSDEDSEADPQPAEEVDGEADEPNADDDEADAVEPDLPAIDPPQFWDATGREEFAKLSREAQQAVVAYEKQRTAAVSRAMEQSTQARKAAEAKQQQLREVIESLNEYTDQTESNLEAWGEWFASDEALHLAKTNPAAFAEAQVNHRRATQEHEKAKADKAKADRKLLTEHVTEVSRQMAEMVPELFDPKEGKARRGEMVKYLKTSGFDEDRIQWITAHEAQLAWKAYKYDQAQAVAQKAPAAPSPKKPKPSGPNAPVAGQGQRPSSSEARFKQLSAKSSLSLDEAAERSALRKQLRK